jgi:ribosomal protein S2
MSIVTLPQLLEAGVHFGHKASSWNPKMRPYIFAERNGIHIIDLVQTARYLNEAYEYVREGAEKGWRFLFVGTKRQAAGIIVDQRREANAVRECIKLKIPIISLLDTNCDPDLSDVFIPANDDAIRAIKLIVGKLADAIYEGRHGQLDTGEEEEYDYEGAMDLEEDILEDLGDEGEADEGE